MVAIGSVVAWRSWPANPQSLFDQAMAVYPTDLAETEWLLRKAIKASDGQHVDAAALLGCALARRGDWQGVSRQLEEINLNRARPDLLTELGELAMSADESDLAIKMFTVSASRSGPQQSQSLVMLVLLHRSARRATDALQCAEQLTQLEPGDDRWWRMLAQLHQQQGDEVREAETFRRALQQPLPPQHARAIRHRLFETLVHLGDAPAARLALEQLE